MQIESPKNPLFQEVRRATASGRPMEDGCVVLEGPHLLEEVMRGRWRLCRVIATEGAQERQAGLLSRAPVPVVTASERAMQSLGATESTQGVVALARPAAWTGPELGGGGALVVVLDGIQDPGNAGTTVRSAEAFGATGVIFVRPSVRVSNGKFLRGSAGSIFRLPFVEDLSAAEASRVLREMELTLFALSPEGAMELSRADLRQRCAVVVGNEGAGVSKELLKGASGVRIAARVESLNAAVACSIALFEAARQRAGA